MSNLDLKKRETLLKESEIRTEERGADMWEKMKSSNTYVRFFFKTSFKLWLIPKQRIPFSGFR